MNSAAEARFRLPVGAAVARAVKVIALDPACDRLVASRGGISFDHAGRSLSGPPPDLVVMVVTAGSDAPAAARIGQICSDRRITTATFVVRAASVTDEELSRTLAQVRPWSLMVVITNDDDYVEDILRSFR